MHTQWYDSFQVWYKVSGWGWCVDCVRIFYFTSLSSNSLSNNLYFSDSHHVGWYFCASRGIHFPPPLYQNQVPLDQPTYLRPFPG